MTEFFRPELRERAAESLLKETGEIYDFKLKKNVRDVALDFFRYNDHLQTLFNKDKEKTLFLLSQLSSMNDAESQEKNFTQTSSIIERNVAFYRRIIGENTSNISSGDRQYFEPYSVCIEETEAYRADFNAWQSGDFLSVTRQKFGITPENEKPYDLIVTELDLREFMLEYSSSGFVSYATKHGKPMICLPRGTDENVLVHEYIHTQHRLFFGSLDLGRGFEEGFVEASTPEPFAYIKQRELVGKVATTVPNAVDLLTTSRNYPHAREEFFRRTVQTYGINGLNYILRASPDETHAGKRFYEADMYKYMLSPDEVAGALDAIRRNTRAKIAAR